MNTKYEGNKKEENVFNKFRETHSPVVPEVYVLPEKGIALVRHRTHYGQLNRLIAAAFPGAGKEAHDYENIQISHLGRDFMNALGKGEMYSAFTNKEWNSDRFVIIPLSEKERIQELLFMPHIERISISDIQEAKDIYQSLIAHNEFGAYDHRGKLRGFGLKPEQVIIDELDHSITINAEGDCNVGTEISLVGFLRDLNIMGFEKIKLDLKKTGVFLGQYKLWEKWFDSDFSEPKTWLPEAHPMEIFIDIEGCRNIKNSSSTTTYNTLV